MIQGLPLREAGVACFASRAGPILKRFAFNPPMPISGIPSVAVRAAA